MAQETFGQQLRRLRKTAGLTQQVLATRAGVALRSIIDLESDRRERPREATLCALADALSLDERQRAAFAGALPGERATRGDLWRAALRLPPHELVGRDESLTELRAVALPDESRFRPRLITLVGPAGVGKTHLAMQLAADLADDYRDGVYRADLAGLPSYQDLPRAVARAIGLPSRTGLNQIDALAGAIGARQLLVVLDGCETLLDPVADLVTILLRRCPALRFVIPCRAPLETEGEVVRAVAPLGVPGRAALPTFRQEAAVRLLAARAAAISPHLVVTRENAGLIEAVCRQSGGLPLALGLLAGRLIARPPERDEPIERALQGAVPLADLIAGSYRRLAPEGRRLLRYLACFVANWPCEASAVAASKVGGCYPDPLRSLELAGMIQAEGQGPDRRYRLHPAIGAHALAELRASGEEPLARAAHLDWCLALARASAGTQRHSAVSGAALDHADHDLAHALIWALDHDRDRGRRLARFLRQGLGERHGDETSWARLLPHLE